MDGYVNSKIVVSIVDFLVSNHGNDDFRRVSHNAVGR